MNELLSLNTIFKNKIFKIPDYQRWYAWTTKQLTDFWEDLINLPDDRFHYIWLLSLKKVDQNVWERWNDESWLIKDKSYKPFYIVDWQQRLTTFIIFIQSIYELIVNLPENFGKKDDEIYIWAWSLKDIKEDYIVEKRPPNFTINAYKFWYEVDNPSFQFLRNKIFKEQEWLTTQETFYTLNLENAKKFFDENLKNYFEQNWKPAVELIFKKLILNLMFNVYDISDDFNVYVAFETMNNRWKKLSNLELLKNRLIYLTTLYNNVELKNDEKISLREKINDSWKEIYYQLWRNKQSPLNDDDFLNAHWIIYFQYTREKWEEYIKFLLEQKFTAQNIFKWVLTWHHLRSIPL
jgi:uncharacterized protein with ParB-like and HNH nuclease domain